LEEVRDCLDCGPLAKGLGIGAWLRGEISQGRNKHP